MTDKYSKRYVSRRLREQPCGSWRLGPRVGCHEENGQGYLLTQESINYYYNHYVPAGTDRKHVLLSPFYAASFTGLPPAHIIAAEFDPLRDEGEAYAEKLQAAGVPVTCRRYEGMIHAFFSLDGILDQGKKAIDEAATALRTAFAKSNAQRDTDTRPEKWLDTAR